MNKQKQKHIDNQFKKISAAILILGIWLFVITLAPLFETKQNRLSLNGGVKDPSAYNIGGTGNGYKNPNK